MFFIAGIGSRVKDLGLVNGSCLACGGNGKLHIAKDSQSVSLFFIPVASFGAKYLVTCGECASVMELTKEAGKRLERDPTSFIRSHELTLLKNLNAQRCPSCGRRVYSDQRFCPGCGERL